MRETIGPYFARDPKTAAIFSDGGTRKNASGIHVTEENALTFSAVFDAVNQISSDVAKLPLNLHKRLQGSGSEHYVDSKLYRLLKYEPNPEMGSMTFRQTITAHALTSRGGFAEIVRDGAGRPVQLWPIAPCRIRPYRDRDGTRLGPLKYRVDEKTDLDPGDVLHIHGLGYDGYTGYGVIDKARQAIGLAMAAETFGASFFGNGSTFGGILTDETGSLDDEERRKDVVNALKSRHQGAERAYQLLLLYGGLKFQPTGISPDKAQMNELRMMQIEEVARFFNLPVHKLKNLDRATNNNIEQQDLEYYKGCLLHWITLWEEECNRKLISPLEARQQYVKHNVNALLRGDITSRYTALGIARDKGIICADEWRELEEWGPQPGTQGKIFLVQQAMVPADRINDVVDAQIEKAKKPKGTPAPPPAPADAAAVASATERAAEAVRIAAEATEAARVAREALVALEATAGVTAEQLVAARASADAALQQAGSLTALSLELEHRATHTAAALESASAEVEARDLVIVDLTAQRDTASQASEASSRELQALKLEREQLAAAAATAREAATVAETEAAASRAAVATADLKAQEAHVARVSAENAATAAREAVQRAEAAMESAKVTAAAAAVSADEAVTAATTRADQAVESLEQETARREAALAEVERCKADVQSAAVAQQQAEAATAAARAAVTVAEEAVVAARTSEQEASDTRDREIAKRTESERLLAEALARAEQSTLDAQTARAAQQTAEVARQTALDALEAANAQIRTITDERAALVADLRQQITVAQAAVAEAERARGAADQSRETALETCAAAVEGRASLQADLDELRQGDADARAVLIGAHRALVVDIMRRMVERETERAGRARVSVEKLTAWLESSFYGDHEELCHRALLPAVRIHLAFIGSAEDAVDATRRLVQAHVADSQRQLRTMLEGDADELAASFTALMYRWEQERPAAIADALMREELRYASRSR